MCNALSTYLDHDNASAVFAAADSYQCEELKEQAFNKIVRHFALAARSEGWVALTKEQLSQVIDFFPSVQYALKLDYDVSGIFVRKNDPSIAFVCVCVSVVCRVAGAFFLSLSSLSLRVSLRVRVRVRAVCSDQTCTTNSASLYLVVLPLSLPMLHLPQPLSRW